MSLDCYCSYSAPTLHRCTLQKARKEHMCEECGGTIIATEAYENVFGIWEGYAYAAKTCQRCVDLRQWVKNNVPCFCWAYGNMVENAKETIEEARFRAPEETVGLYFGFLRRFVGIKRFNKQRLAGEKVSCP